MPPYFSKMGCILCACFIYSFSNEESYVQTWCLPKDTMLISPLALATIYSDTGKLSFLKTKPARKLICMASNLVSVCLCWTQVRPCPIHNDVIPQLTQWHPFKVNTPLTPGFLLPPQSMNFTHRAQNPQDTIHQDQPFPTASPFTFLWEVILCGVMRENRIWAPEIREPLRCRDTA